jgi:hypothetical protein
LPLQCTVLADRARSTGDQEGRHQVVTHCQTVTLRGTRAPPITVIVHAFGRK